MEPLAFRPACEGFVTYLILAAFPFCTRITFARHDDGIGLIGRLHRLSTKSSEVFVCTRSRRAKLCFGVRVWSLLGDDSCALILTYDLQWNLVLSILVEIIDQNQDRRSIFVSDLVPWLRLSICSSEHVFIIDKVESLQVLVRVGHGVNVNR